MPALELMDSRKFMGLMERLITVWGNDESDDLDKACALDDVLAAAGPQVQAAPMVSAVVGGKLVMTAQPVVPRPAELPDNGTLTMTPEEESRMARAADEAAAQTMPREDLVKEVINEYIKPKYFAGHRHFGIPLRYKGRSLSQSPNVWLPMLKIAGIHVEKLNFIFDERSWQGPWPGADQMPLVLR